MRNTFQWNIIWNSNVFKKENAFEKIICEKVAILSQPQCVKAWWLMYMSLIAVAPSHYHVYLDQWWPSVIWTSGNIVQHVQWNLISVTIWTFPFKQLLLNTSSTKYHYVQASLQLWLCHMVCQCCQVIIDKDDMLYAKACPVCHDGVTTWNVFPYYWPFVRGIHRSLVTCGFPSQRASYAELWWLLCCQFK